MNSNWKYALATTTPFLIPEGILLVCTARSYVVVYSQLLKKIVATTTCLTELIYPVVTDPRHSFSVTKGVVCCLRYASAKLWCRRINSTSSKYVVSIEMEQSESKNWNCEFRNLKYFHILLSFRCSFLSFSNTGLALNKSMTTLAIGSNDNKCIMWDISAWHCITSSPWTILQQLWRSVLPITHALPGDRWWPQRSHIRFNA